MSEWVEKRLGDFISFKYGKMPYDNIKKDSGLYPIFSGYRITGYCSDYNIEKGELVIVARGVGGTGDVKITPQRCYLTNLAIAFDVNANVANKQYLFYLFAPSKLRYLDSGAAQSQITITDLQRVKISLPSLPTQTRIADILSAYDDAIENNNRRITLLEKAARELYCEWFVRFRFPGYGSVRFVNGLPEGWEIKRMDNFCHVTDGTHLSPKQLTKGIPLITSRCINNGFIDFSKAYFISESDHEEIKRRSGLDSGDILFSNIGTIGRICIVDYDREFSVKNVIIFKPNNSTEMTYLYYLMISPTIQNIFASQTTGASQQFVSLDFMRSFKILVPDKQLLEKFGCLIMPILNAKQALQSQSQNLARQRDLLLPRLVSGRLDVTKLKNKAIGSSFDDFLEEEDISEDVESGAIKKIGKNHA